jgi:hypothetical protein
MSWKAYELMLFDEGKGRNFRLIQASWTWDSNLLVFSFSINSPKTEFRYAYFEWTWNGRVTLHSTANFCDYFKNCIDSWRHNTPQPLLEQSQTLAERGEQLFALMSTVREEFLSRALPNAIQAYEAEQQQRADLITAETIGRWLDSQSLPVTNRMAIHFIRYRTDRARPIQLTVQPFVFDIDYREDNSETVSLAQVLWDSEMRVQIVWSSSLESSLFKHLRAETRPPRHPTQQQQLSSAQSPTQVLQICAELVASTEREFEREQRLPGTPLYPFSVLRLFAPLTHKKTKI